MKKFYSTLLLASLSLAVSGVFAGCSMSGSIDPNHDVSNSKSGSTSTYKKTEVRDANGNLIEKKVESKSNN